MSLEDGTQTPMAPTPPDQQTTDRAGGRRTEVELRLPAEGVYATIVRTTAAGLAARLDFTIDEIEDLRIAIGEASALVIPQADPDTDLVCRFLLAPGSMTVELETGAVDDPEADRDSFAWQVLQTLADDVTAGSSGGRFHTRFTVRSQIAAGTTGADR
jgi:serine/threonine-protein kinase RsbW